MDRKSSLSIMSRTKALANDPKARVVLGIHKDDSTFVIVTIGSVCTK